MSNLQTMTTNICGILSLNQIDPIDYMAFQELYETLDSYFRANCKQYAFILHDLDTLPSGELKTKHIHFVATGNKRKRLSTWLYDISENTGLNTSAITISKYTSFEASFQYLVHRNDEDKVQYCSFMIHTNLPKQEVRILLAEEAVTLDLDRLSDIVCRARSKTEVLQKVGLYYYRLYRGVILDLWHDLHPYGFRDVRCDKNGEIRNA